MAETVEQIAETLDTMRSEGERNNKKLEEVLVNINSKLELISENDELTETFRMYVSGLKKTIEDGYSKEILKFEELQENFEKIILSQDDLIKKDELKSLFNTYTENFNNLLTEVNNRKLVIDDISKKVANIDEKAFDKDEIISLIQNVSLDLTSINSNIEKIFIDISKTLNDFDFSEKIEDVLETVKSLDYKDNFDSITDKISEIKENFSDTSKNNYESLKSKLDLLAETIKDNLADDNSYTNISKDIENLNENLAGSINDIRLSFENNSKMNYESLVNEINDLKSEINKNLKSKDNTEEIEQINSSLSDIISNIQFMRDISTQRYTELIENTSLEIHSALSDINNDISTNNELNFSDVKSLIEVVNTNIQELKKDLLEKKNSGAFIMSNGFNNLKSSVENLFNIFTAHKAAVEQIFSENFEKFSIEIRDLSEKLDNYDDKSDSQVEIFDLIKEGLAKLSTETSLVKFELEQNYRDGNEQQLEKIEQLRESILSIKSDIDETYGNIKESIEDLSKTSQEDKSNNKAEIIQKLSDIEAAVVQSFQDYDYKSENLQSKLGEFLQSIEGSNSDTEGKISASLDEIASIKTDLISIGEALKTFKLSNDEKLSENISLLDAGIENIIFNLNSLNENFKKGLEDNIKEGLSGINEKFSDLAQIFIDIKKDDDPSYIIEQIEEKTAVISEELKLVNTDIIEAYQSNTEDILNAFAPIKTSVEELLAFDFNKLFNNFKSQLEISLADFYSRLEKSNSDDSKNIIKLGEALKETFNRISNVEECLSKKIINDIELINASIASGMNEIKNSVPEKLEEQILEIQTGIDILLNKNNIAETVDGLKKYFDETYSKFDEVIKNNSLILDKQISAIDNSIKNNNAVLKQCFDEINLKIDILAGDESNENLFDEIDEIKEIIIEQKKVFESSSDERFTAIDKYLKDVLVKLDNVDVEKNAEDIKESIMNALVSLVDQISFVEETEEIKDFVEEKTGEINQNILDVQNQLKQLTTSEDAFDYKYTLQDVESDIAKLRLAINNMQGSDFSDISAEINKLVDIVENIESTLTQEQIVNLKSDIEKLNEDIVSISTRTNKLLLNSDESYKTINDGLNNFSEIIYKLEERLENKLNNIQNYASASANADKIFHQAMMYLGEWVDTTTESISSISDKTSQIYETSKQIANLQEAAPGKDDIISEIKGILPDNKDIISKLVSKFELQETRIDALENKLDKLLSIIEEKDDTILNRKIEKIEKILSKLGNNVEKLTSYVDEE